MIELNADNLNDELQGNAKVFVQFGASWCGNCRMIKPKIKNLANDYADIKFIYVDAEKYPESRKLADVKNLPTYAVYKDGQLVNQTMGNKIELVKELVDEIASN